jgi:hypothetical protein
MSIQSGLPVDRSIRLLVGTFVWLHMGSFSPPPSKSEESLLVRFFLQNQTNCEDNKYSGLRVVE